MFFSSPFHLKNYRAVCFSTIKRNKALSILFVLLKSSIRIDTISKTLSIFYNAQSIVIIFMLFVVLVSEANIFGGFFSSTNTCIIIKIFPEIPEVKCSLLLCCFFMVGNREREKHHDLCCLRIFLRSNSKCKRHICQSLVALPLGNKS